MFPQVSVSKGCFVYKNGVTRAGETTKTTTKRMKQRTGSGILGKEVTDQLFYAVYSELWQRIKTDIEELQARSNERTLNELINFVANESKNWKNADTYGMKEIVPAAVLLTGINQPDHLTQFEMLSNHLCERLSATVCMLQSRDCPSLKAAVESMVYNLIEAPHVKDVDRNHKRLRRSQCTIKELKRWYSNNYGDATEEDMPNDQRHSLIIILPDFECFNSVVLQDLILLLSAKRTELPFCLVLGVATAVSAVHGSLPYHVTSRIKLCVAQMQSAPVALNEMLDKIFLSPKYAFHLSGKALKFFTHIFLYYDFSINGFIQGYKYCMMEHYFRGNAYALCTTYCNSLIKTASLTHEDMETIRQLLSFRPYVESINDCKRIIAILTDDGYLKKKLPQLLSDCHVYFMVLRTFLEFLIVLVGDLPKCPLGKYRRELYELCLTKELHIQPEFKECWQILSFMSKDEFTAKISKAIKATEDFVTNEIELLELSAECTSIVNSKLKSVRMILEKIITAGMQVSTETASAPNTSNAKTELKQLSSRQDLKEKLLQMSKQDKPISEFTKNVRDMLNYIELEIVKCCLKPLQRAPPLYELFFFTDITSVRRNLIGAPRAALHMALNNPHFYLQCKCCHLDDQTQLLPSLPDISVAYKLHLECGRMINLFDWLQAFRAVVCQQDEENEIEQAIDPEIQARFTRAVSELQFLGYIKMSKRKTDHAMRLTW